MVVVTHEMSFARDVADRVIFMDEAILWKRENRMMLSTILKRKEQKRSWSVLPAYIPWLQGQMMYNKVNVLKDKGV